ncbi:MAG: calcium-binding protein [Myxococcota bacterium]
MLVTIGLILWGGGNAWASMMDCSAGDAPAAFLVDGCNSVCTESGGTIVCTPTNFCDAGVSYSVVRFDVKEISAFGTCEVNTKLVNWCCNANATGVTTVQAFGTEFADKIGFSHPLIGGGTSTTRDLFPLNVQMSAAMDGGDEIDVLQGSNYAGTDYGESLSGGDGADFINGLGGNDTLYGGNHDDQLFGGLGSDTIYGQGGDDLIFGDVDADPSTGLGDILAGGAGSDTIHGGGGNDVLSGDVGQDFMFGEDGDDRLVGGKGNDELNGGIGNDVMGGQEGVDLLEGGPGDDLMHGGYGGDTLLGESGDDTLYGSLGNDTMNGGADDDILCERAGYRPGNGPLVCDDWNQFVGGASTGDVAFTNLGLDGPDCTGVTDFLGNQTAEVAGIPVDLTGTSNDRDWSAVLQPGLAPGYFPEPATCTWLIADPQGFGE